MGSPSNNKKLAKNVLLFALSNFVPKVMNFLLVPVYTAYLTTEDYGTSDLIITTASLLLPIFTLNVNNAVLRFTIESKQDKRPYAIGMKITIVGCAALALVLVITAMVSDIRPVYLALLFLLCAVSGDYQLKVAYLRAMEHVSFLSVCTILCNLATLVCNILFIVVFRLGLYGFVLSSITGYLLMDVMVQIRYRKEYPAMWGISPISEKTLTKEMLVYCTPLILSGIAWWVTSVSDRYVLTWIVGVSATGIYTVANKLPVILQTVESVFTPAWTLQVYDVYKKDGGMEYIGKTYDYYNFIMVFLCSGLIFLDKPLARLLFSNEFYEAWRYVPALLISVVFLSMSSFVGVLLAAYKQSQISARGSVFNAILNTGLNVILIYLIGVQGAALATMASYGFSLAYTWFHVRKLCTIPVNFKKHLFMYLLLLVQMTVVLYVPQFWLSGIIVLVIAVINADNVSALIRKSVGFGKNMLTKIHSSRGDR